MQENQPYSELTQFIGSERWTSAGPLFPTCVEDTGLEPIVTQKIEYTDFPFPRSGLFLLYVGNDGPGTMTKIFLPSEY
jgi:hypothetical protein